MDYRYIEYLGICLTLDDHFMNKVNFVKIINQLQSKACKQAPLFISWLERVNEAWIDYLEYIIFSRCCQLWFLFPFGSTLSRFMNSVIWARRWVCISNPCKNQYNQKMTKSIPQNFTIWIQFAIEGCPALEQNSGKRTSVWKIAIDKLTGFLLHPRIWEKIFEVN